MQFPNLALLNKCAILIPSLNPDQKLIDLIKQLNEIGVFNVVVVDDGSDTKYKPIFKELLSNNLCHVLSHVVNQGKGRALKTGMNYFLTIFPDYIGVITADCDGQHKPGDIKKVMQSLIDNPNHLIIGVRDFKEQGIPFRSRFGNILTRNIFGFLTGIKVSDTQTGLRGIPSSFMKTLLTTSGEHFEFEMNMLMECKQSRIAIFEEFIDTIYLDRNKTSHFNPLLDSAKIYLVFLKYISSSILAACIDFIIFYFATTLGAGIALAIIFARLISSIANFTINKTAVFHSHNKLYLEILKYYGLVLFSGLIAYYSIIILTKRYGLNLMLAKITIETSLFFANYIVQKGFVFAYTMRSEKVKWEK